MPNLFAVLKNNVERMPAQQLRGKSLQRDTKVNKQVVEILAPVGDSNLVSRSLVIIDVAEMTCDDILEPRSRDDF